MDEAARAIVRAAAPDDCHEVYALLRRLGMRVPATPAAERASWDRLWKTNPALRAGATQAPAGWILQSSAGRVAGFFGSIPLRYHLGDRELHVAAASHWGVEQDFRSRTADLAAAYFVQPAIDLFLVTTAILPVARIFARHDGQAMPLRSYERVLFWVLDARAFVAAVLTRRGTAAAIASVAAPLLALPLALRNALPRRKPGKLHTGLEPERVALAAVIGDVEGLWRRKLADCERLFAARSSADLRWRFGASAREDEWTFLRCRRHGRCAGTLVLRRERLPEYGLARSRIVDLLAERDDPGVIEALLAGAGEIARERGDHVLEWFGFPDEIRKIAERSHPLSRSLPGNPFHFKAQLPQLGTLLDHQRAWYPTLYDGDSSL